jgi:phosphatidylserine/phosphatidylglycerophosphate/cardiolipin synthase-like enzyme/uncharacterized membrane protein YdjX (TVP38/TMEM64 family)
MPTFRPSDSASALRRSPSDQPSPSPEDGSSSQSLFRPGENCWRVERADRIGLLIDGQEYFLAVKEAIERAERTIIILAWDFDSRAGLEFDSNGAATVTVGDLLNRWVRRHAGRRVYALIWDYPMIYGIDREFPPVYGLGWRPHPRIHICYDDAIPVGAAHHQKVVVIDDRIAFCGGLDLTARRWDTCEHKASESRRVANGKSYPPFHDAMMAVSGPAAAALGELARERWRSATGRVLPQPVAARWRRWARSRRPRVTDPWPASLSVSLTDTEVAISRTLPASHPRAAEPQSAPPAAAVREVETMYLDLIRAAERSIYVENQYFTAARLGDALAERLAEPDGPEVVVVLRLLSHGWIEAMTMQRLRTALIVRLRAADRHGRLQVYYPHVAGLDETECLDVHSKLMVVDDRALRIGSANFANRSMGFDTECDLTIDAGGDPARAAVVAAFRDRLLGEHLGVEPERIAEAVASHGSLIAAIDSLREPPDSLDPDRRTLLVLETTEDEANALGGVLHLADPEAAVPLGALVGEFQPAIDIPAGQRLGWRPIGALVLLVLALTAVWRWTPLSTALSGEAVVAMARSAASVPWTVPVLILGYAAATFVMFPRPLLTLFAALAYGPWLGFLVAMAGILAATGANYVVGRQLPREMVRRYAGPSLNRIVRTLEHRGVLAMTVLRLVPIAPFAVPGIVAGAIHLRLRDVLLGTALGNVPGTLVTTVLGGRLQAVLERAQPIDYWIVAGIVAAALVTVYLLRRSGARLHLPTRA